jgi:hypothetical protein
MKMSSIGASVDRSSKLKVEGSWAPEWASVQLNPERSAPPRIAPGIRPVFERGDAGFLAEHPRECRAVERAVALLAVRTALFTARGRLLAG